MHHAFAIEAVPAEGIELARAWAKEHLGLSGASPDVVVLTYGLFSVEDARGVGDIAAQAPIAGESKVIIIAAARAYREAQNALLKLFEEPPAGTTLFLKLPSLGGLLLTLRSRIQILSSAFPQQVAGSKGAEEAMQFLKATREKRSAIVKKLAAGRDEDERREHRDEALAIVNGIEAAVYTHVGGRTSHMRLLGEIQTLRGYLHERSAPVRMILEHLAIVAPNCAELGIKNKE